jgi:Toprim domain
MIALNRDIHRLGEAMDEARLFLAVPRPVILPRAHRSHAPPVRHGSSEAARRLFRAGRPVPGTPAEAYLRARGITGWLDWSALRYHPSTYYRAAEHAPLELWPALLAAVTALDGTITGILRTWLDRERPAKAPIADPRRAMGYLLGNGVRFGQPTDIAAAGEGIETMLALKSVLPAMPMIAGLSANHLAALDLPPALRRLYVARDNDAAGLHAAARLRERHHGIDVRELVPVHADFNHDLCRLGADGLRARLKDQLAPADLGRSLSGPSDPRT